MKRVICLILALVMCLGLFACGDEPAQDDDSLPTICDADGTSTMPADKSLVLVDHTEKHTDLTVDEKLEILNGLKNKEFESAFLVIEVLGRWVSVEVSEDKEAEAFGELIDFFASPDVVYEHFQGDDSMLHEYNAYVTFTDTGGNEYTLFVHDTQIYHEDQITGELPDGTPQYAQTDCAAICFDGDWFIIRDTLGWWRLTRIDVKYTGFYE